MDVKEVTKTAREYVVAVFADEEITQLGLEEVMYDPDSEQWRITFGFARPWDQQNTMAVKMGLKTPRAYKVVSIDNGNGKVVALTDRLLQASNACHDPNREEEARAKSGRWSKILGSWQDWRYTPVSLFKIFLLYPGAGVGATTALTIWIPKLADVDGVLASSGCIVGLIVGAVSEGRAWRDTR